MEISRNSTDEERLDFGNRRSLLLLVDSGVVFRSGVIDGSESMGVRISFGARAVSMMGIMTKNCSLHK